MATAAEVERSLRSLMEKLDGADVKPDSVPERTVICIVPDIERSFRSEIVDSRFAGLEEIEDGTSAEADVRITARSDDLIALIDGRLNVGFAFLTGKVRVDASTADLMMIRGLF